MKTKKTILLLIGFSILVCFRIYAQNPVFEWAVQIGGDSAIQPNSIVIDANGNQIITGTFKGIADFDPGAGIFNLTSSGLEDIFIQKLSPDGNLLWASGMGDINSDRGSEVVTDASGYIYVTGYFDGTIDADPGQGYFELSQTKTTAFVLKIEPDGDLIWAKQMGFPGDWGLALGFSITLDNNLNIVTSGIFYGRVDFDPGPGTFNLSSNGDGYIQKLDASGNFLWAKQIAGTEHKICYSLATDPSGGIYCSGWFKGTVDFNPDKNLKYNLTSYGDYDAFILKLSSTGNFAWAKQIGGPEQDLSYSVTRDLSGNIYIDGYFTGTADFNPGSGTYTMTSYGNKDAFILKLDPTGNFMWAKQLGGPLADCAHDLKLDLLDNVYVSGYFYSTADFDPGPGTSYLTANGMADCFVFKSDPDGNLLWVTQTGGPGLDYGFALAVDASGSIFNVGYFAETVDFNPSGNGIFEFTNFGAQDMYIQKLNPSGGDNCLIPFSLTSENITETSANLGWNAVSGVGGYFVRYREIGTTWVEIPAIVNATNLKISGLIAASAYEFQVKTDCYSNYSYSCEFNTAGGACPDNYEPNETMVTAASIQVNTDVSALVGVSGDYDWFTFSTTNSAKNIKITLTNLTADYNVKLYKSNGTLIGSSQNTGTATESIIYNTTKTGVYFISVYGIAGAFNPIDCYTMKAAVSSTSFKSADIKISTTEITEELIVYPNPSSSVFHVMLETNSKELVTIQLFDFSGRLVEEYNSLSPEDIITIGNDLRVGVFVAVVTQGEYRKFIKIIKTK